MNIGLGEENRKLIASGLARLQSDSALLYLKTHNFHWNVTGPHFSELHKLFEEQYQEIWESVDEIAERIRALGEQAPGSYARYIELTKIEEENGHPSWQEMTKQLVLDNEAVVRTSRECFEQADKAGDQATADLLTRRILTHEKYAWMLRSLID